MGWIYKLTSPAAIRKYGIDTFVIEKWQFPDEYLIEYERLFIEDHGTLSPDNLKAAGYDDRPSDETRAKLKGRVMTEDHKRKIRTACNPKYPPHKPNQYSLV